MQDNFSGQLNGPNPQPDLFHFDRQAVINAISGLVFPATLDKIVQRAYSAGVDPETLEKLRSIKDQKFRQKRDFLRKLAVLR